MPLDGARPGAPEAQQVADRWHLYHNLSGHVEKAVARHRGCLAEPAPEPEPDEAGGEAPVPDLQQAAAEAASRRAEESALAVRTRQRYEQVQALRAQGQGIKPIMRQTGLAKGTVRRFYRAAAVDELLAKVRDGRPSLPDDYKPCLHQRWNEGCTNVRQLHAELTQRGYTGGYGTIRDYVLPFRQAGAAPPAVPGPPKPVVVEPVVNMRKLLELLELQTEGPTVDYKELYDLRKDAPLRKRHLVELAKHVGAMSVQGGFLVVGVDDHGVPTGALSVEQASYFDEARLRPMLLTWLPKALEIRSQKHEIDGKPVVLIYVARNPAGFAVFEADGQYSDGKKTTTVFSKGDIFWRDGTQSCRIDQRGLEQIIARARPADAPSPLPEIAAPAGTAQPGVASGTDITVFQPPRTRNLHFAGREDKLAQLDATLSSGAPAAILQAISGLGGIGKTELAIEYAHRRRDLYDLVFTLYAGTEATLLADMRVLAGKVGLSQAWDEPRERVLQWLSQRGRWLLILDNAAALSSVADYLPEGPGHILVTSRDHVWRQRAAQVCANVVAGFLA